MSSLGKFGSRPQSGMVLIAVLWMVAALSILVTGITRSVREEARTMALGRQSVEAAALGDAAIHLVLQDMVSRTTPVRRLTYVDTVYRGVSIRVQVMPLNGLVNINTASLQLLAGLYAVAGEVPQDRATALAQATVDARSRRDSRGASERFAAPEDLLKVPGIDYTLYAKLSKLVTADLRGGGKVNPMAAPPEVLVVLASGNANLASRIATDRDAGKEGIDTTALEAGFIDAGSVQRFRIEARVPLPNGGGALVSRSVELNPRGRDGLPWRTFHTQRGFETALRKSS